MPRICYHNPGNVWKWIMEHANNCVKLTSKLKKMNPGWPPKRKSWKPMTKIPLGHFKIASNQIQTQKKWPDWPRKSWKIPEMSHETPETLWKLNFKIISTLKNDSRMTLKIIWKMPEMSFENIANLWKWPLEHFKIASSKKVTPEWRPKCWKQMP